MPYIDFPLEIHSDITLELVGTRHAQEIYELVMRNKEQLAKFLPWVSNISAIGDIETFIQSVVFQQETLNGFQTVVIYQKKIAGIIGYHFIDNRNHIASIGYWLAPDFWGKGIMPECCKFYINYAFEKLELNRVELSVSVNNLQSMRVVEKLGMYQEGVKRGAEFLNGTYEDHAIYSVLKREWVQE